MFSLLQKSVVSIFDAVYSVEQLAITPGSNCATRNVFFKNINARIQVLQGAVTVVIPPL